MNEHIRMPSRRQPTGGAEGLPRWRWTVADLDRMVEVGLLAETDRVELIEGEIVPLAAKGNRHDLVKDEVANQLTRATAPTLRIANESGWTPVDDFYCEPDIRIYPRTFQPRSVPATEILLLIEVAESSLGYDLGTKAAIYAGLGVTEYWVVEAHTLVTHVHRDPTPDGWEKIEQVSPGLPLTAQRLNGISLRLTDLQLD